jgi:hypothetical protein
MPRRSLLRISTMSARFGISVPTPAWRRRPGRWITVGMSRCGKGHTCRAGGRSCRWPRCGTFHRGGRSRFEVEPTRQSAATARRNGRLSAPPRPGRAATTVRAPDGRAYATRRSRPSSSSATSTLCGNGSGGPGTSCGQLPRRAGRAPAPRATHDGEAGRVQAMRASRSRRSSPCCRLWVNSVVSNQVGKAFARRLGPRKRA